MTTETIAARPTGRAAAINPLLTVFLVAAALGWAAATFLTAVHLWALPLPAGIEPQGSLRVITSDWAYVGPVPLALVGTAYYTLMLVIGGLWLTTKEAWIERAVLPLTLVGLAASAGLVYLQLGPIGAICPFCMMSAAATTVLFLVELSVRRLGGAASTPAARPSVVWPALVVAVAVLAVVAMLGVDLAPIPGT